METAYKSRGHSDKKGTIIPQEWAEARDRKFTENLPVAKRSTNALSHLIASFTASPQERIEQGNFRNRFIF